MTKLIITTVIVTILVGAYLGLAPMQAYAATKLIDIKNINVPLTFPTDGSFCGTDTAFVGKQSDSFVLWDSDGDGVVSADDKLDSHINAHGELVDASGAHVGTSSEVDHFNGNAGVLPITVQLNFVVTCDGAGQVANVHLGSTIDENGGVHFHSS